MSYRQKPRPKWLIARKQGKKPVKVVAGKRFRLKKRAQKEASSLNKDYRGSGIRFVVRKEGWNRKRWWS